MDTQLSIDMHLTFFPSDNLQIFITGAGFLLGEFINEKGNADCMDGLSSDEKFIVVVNYETKEDKSGQHGGHRQKHLGLRRLPLNPSRNRLDRLLRCAPHYSLPQNRTPTS